MTHPQPSGTRVDQAKPSAEPYAVDSVPSPGVRYPGKTERVKATLMMLKPGSDDSFVPDCAGTLVYAAAKQIGVLVVSKPEGSGIRFWRIR